MHRYRSTRAWSVGALAAAAAACAVVATGGLSAGFGAAQARGLLVPPGVEAARATTEAEAVTATPAGPPAAAPQPSGWQIQVGAFRSTAAATARLSSAASEVPALAGLSREALPSGAVARARFGGISSRSAALQLCRQLSRTGRGCFVVAPRG